jgi:tRNA (guanine-N7-)-methyltransferase
MRIRQHTNPLLAAYDHFRGRRPVFHPGWPTEVEIGCAEAQFLFERAAQDPERDYVGLEIREELVDLVNKKAGAAAVPVTAVFCQAQKHLLEIFGPAAVDRLYINFPDPWFKRRHAERRMVDDVLIAGCAAVARPGAELLVQTDVWELAIEAMAAIEARDDVFVNRAGAWSFWRGGNPYGVRSWREQNAEETGLPVWRLWYTRR